MTLILGLETSCDETAAAVVRDGGGVLSNVVATQHDLHERYAGVVPEIASRAHLERLTPVVTEALAQAEVELPGVDAIAVGHRPGLIGSLIVGVAAAKALAWSLNKPLLGVDHVRAHLHAAALFRPKAAEPPPPEGGDKASDRPPPIAYPALGLVVSGGHTTLYRMDAPADLAVLGRTIDDAVGEAYDKAAVTLGLPYPGGPHLDRLARNLPDDAPLGPDVPDLPVSMLGPDSLDFSFSGLKTALLYAVRGRPEGRGKSATFPRSAADLTPDRQARLAAAFQRAAVDAVIRKLERAADQVTDAGSPPAALVLGGGVSANSHLRQRILALGKQHGLPVHLPAPEFCVDNAAMIAGHAYAAYEGGDFAALDLPVVATSRH